jgi:hypothetical protein
MNSREFLIELIFWAHLPIIVVFFGLFFVPKSLWSAKVTFHFFYIIIVIGLQFVYTLLMWRKFNILCPLTTLMQYLRGYPVHSKKNYGHSYTAEFLERMRINISPKTVSYMSLGMLVIVTLQFIWFRS